MEKKNYPTASMMHADMRQNYKNKWICILAVLLLKKSVNLITEAVQKLC